MLARRRVKSDEIRLQANEDAFSIKLQEKEKENTFYNVPNKPPAKYRKPCSVGQFNIEKENRFACAQLLYFLIKGASPSQLEKAPQKGLLF